MFIMVNLRDSRNGLLFAFDDGDISDDEFCLLYDVNRSRDDYTGLQNRGGGGGSD